MEQLISMPVLITKSVSLFHCGGVHKIIICIISDVCLVPRHPHHTIHLSSQSYMHGSGRPLRTSG